jgi:hypothetical protein
MKFNNMPASQIGKGKFSTAYRVDNTDIVYILTKTQNDTANDNTKEIYTHIESIHVPYMSTVDTEVYMPRIGFCNVYESRYYAPLTAASKIAWRDYNALKKAWNHIFDESRELLHRNDMLYAICGNFIAYLEKNQIVSAELIRALELIESWSSAFGPNFLFEFSPRNLKVDSHGNLILLDIVFFSEFKSRR